MEGKLAVISGFSGAGKGTVVRKLIETHEGYALSVSMTTRQPRDGETDGVHYHFVSNAAFEKLLEENGFLEHAGYVDHYYGTPRAFVEENCRAGRNVLLEIEVQGAMQIRELYPEAVLIFMSPPDAPELYRRLTGRATEAPETAVKRLRRALEEVESIQEYPCLLINDDADACAESLHALISGGGSDGQDGSSSGGRIIRDPVRKKAFAETFAAQLREILR